MSYPSKTLTVNFSIKDGLKIVSNTNVKTGQYDRSWIKLCISYTVNLESLKIIYIYIYIF